MNVFVYIATTNGPVQVLRITEEDPDVQSVICVDGTHEPLPISRRYQDFVRKGTGLVHRETGHGAYRVDVSDRIDNGDSWQLGLYIAHQLHTHQALGNGAPQAGDLIVWATGAVRVDGRVVRVEGLSEKWSRSGALFERLEACDTLALFPTANANDDWQPLLQPGTTLTAVDSTDKAMSCIAAAGRSPGQLPQAIPVHALRQQRKPPLRPLVPALSIVLLIALLGFILWPQATHRPSDLDDFGSRPAKDIAVIEQQRLGPLIRRVRLKVYHADNCQAGRQAESTPKLQLWQFKDTSLNNLCAILLEAPAGKFILVAIALDTGMPINTEATAQGWQIPLPRSADRPRDYAMALLPEDQAPLLRKALFQQSELDDLSPADKGPQMLAEIVKRNRLSADIYYHRLTR